MYKLSWRFSWIGSSEWRRLVYLTRMMPMTKVAKWLKVEIREDVFNFVLLKKLYHGKGLLQCGRESTRIFRTPEQFRTMCNLWQGEWDIFAPIPPSPPPLHILTVLILPLPLPLPEQAPPTLGVEEPPGPPASNNPSSHPQTHPGRALSSS